MGKETRALLWRLWAIFFLALAVSVMLVLWMTRDFRKTMVEHDYGAAGYLLGHPEEAGGSCMRQATAKTRILF